jgi:predicted nucleic acid-binding protein
VGAAITAGVEVLVTGDKELLGIGRIANLEILSPRQFWERLKAQQQRGAGRSEPRRSR